MKKSLVFSFLIMLVVRVNAQIEFKPGYYINTTNDTVRCLIKDFGWEMAIMLWLLIKGAWDKWPVRGYSSLRGNSTIWYICTDYNE